MTGQFFRLEFSIGGKSLQKRHLVPAVFWLVIFLGWNFWLVENPWRKRHFVPAVFRLVNFLPWSFWLVENPWSIRMYLSSWIVTSLFENHKWTNRPWVMTSVVVFILLLTRIVVEQLFWIFSKKSAKLRAPRQKYIYFVPAVFWLVIFLGSDFWLVRNPWRKRHFVRAVFWLVIFLGWSFWLMESPWSTCFVTLDRDVTFRKKSQIDKSAIDDDVGNLFLLFTARIFVEQFKKYMFSSVQSVVLTADVFQFFIKYLFEKNVRNSSTCIVVYP